MWPWPSLIPHLWGHLLTSSLSILTCCWHVFLFFYGFRFGSVRQIKLAIRQLLATGKYSVSYRIVLYRLPSWVPSSSAPLYLYCSMFAVVSMVPCEVLPRSNFHLSVVNLPWYPIITHMSHGSTNAVSCFSLRFLISTIRFSFWLHRSLSFSRRDT